MLARPGPPVGSAGREAGLGLSLYP
ncbi:protein of unknown function [Cupriavidus taiwanensis]|nr:protein of unknown function [Cupriavidus taiwanensis]